MLLATVLAAEVDISRLQFAKFMAGEKRNYCEAGVESTKTTIERINRIALTALALSVLTVRLRLNLERHISGSWRLSLPCRNI